MPINPVPERGAIAGAPQWLALPAWLEFFRTVFFALFGWKRSFTGAKTHDFGNILAQTEATTTLAVVGVRSGDDVHVTAATQVAGLGVFGYVSADDTVTIVRFNYSAGAIDPASGSFRVVVLQQ